LPTIGFQQQAGGSTNCTANAANPSGQRVNMRMSYTGATRFKANATTAYSEFKDAAINYIANLAEGDRRGLLQKPLDWHPGHPSYFLAMCQLLSALQLLKLPLGARIVEVGSGAGWATEILASLCYRVDCVEPSNEMVEVAMRRVRTHLEHHGVGHLASNVSYQCSTMEECVLPEEMADAVLFFESFHHVIDEHATLRRTVDTLRPGGWIVILGDSNWVPGNQNQEAAWSEEMAMYGTLESPFTDKYLTWVLEQHGFIDIIRHHLVNGLVPVARETEPVRNFALMDAAWVNLVTARKRPTDASAAVAEAPLKEPSAATPPAGHFVFAEHVKNRAPEWSKPMLRAVWRVLR
jgi:2-polyprenyl-3-methyl-5-hydroxy-6-metoxy-1,4-benzoquinol methylase